jgi:hypothetical protein
MRAGDHWSSAHQSFTATFPQLCYTSYNVVPSYVGLGGLDAQIPAIYDSMCLALPGITVLLTKSIGPTFYATDFVGKIGSGRLFPQVQIAPCGSGLDGSMRDAEIAT